MVLLKGKDGWTGDIVNGALYEKWMAKVKKEDQGANVTMNLTVYFVGEMEKFNPKWESLKLATMVVGHMMMQSNKLY
jgi:hypothetical protein